MLPRASGVPCSTSQSVCGGCVCSRTSCSAAHRNRCCEYRSTVLSEAGGPDHCVALAAEALHLCQWAWRPSLTSEVPMVAMARRRETGCAHVSRCVHGVSCEQWPGHDRLIGCAGQNVAPYRAAISARSTAIRQVWAAQRGKSTNKTAWPQVLLLQPPPTTHTAHTSLSTTLLNKLLPDHKWRWLARNWPTAYLYCAHAMHRSQLPEAAHCIWCNP